MISIRKMMEEDIPAGLRLCRAAGWNQVAGDWKPFFDLDQGDVFVAVKDEVVVGTVSTVRYDNRFAWIGMMLVDPEQRRQRIAASLMEHAINHLSGLPCIRLDATPMGREVYLHFDFKDEYVLNRMIAEKVEPGQQVVAAVRRMTAADLSSVFAWDHEVFGADRHFLLEQYWKNTGEMAFVIFEKDALAGYCFGKKGFTFDSVGLLVAKDATVAKQLVTAIASAKSANQLLIDVPEMHTEFTAWLGSLGFRQQRQLIRMYRGDHRWPGLPPLQWSILGPAFG
jgi:GNAT superfamily N-acetyltransferase